MQKLRILSSSLLLSLFESYIYANKEVTMGYYSCQQTNFGLGLRRRAEPGDRLSKCHDHVNNINGLHSEWNPALKLVFLLQCNIQLTCNYLRYMSAPFRRILGLKSPYSVYRTGLRRAGCYGLHDA